jgi:hypothetical protein
LQRLIGGTSVNEMMVSEDDPTDKSAVQTEITALVEERHGIADAQDDFSVRYLADIASAASASATALGGRTSLRFSQTGRGSLRSSR